MTEKTEHSEVAQPPPGVSADAQVDPGGPPAPVVDPDFAMGGQAVIEGVMMRGPRAYAVAVRRPQGDIVTLSRPFVPVAKRKKWLGLPVMRGAVTLFEMLVLGYRTLEYSVQVMEQGLLEQEAQEKAEAEKAADQDPDEAGNPPPASGEPQVGVSEALAAVPSAALASEPPVQSPLSPEVPPAEKSGPQPPELPTGGETQTPPDQASNGDLSPEKTLSGWQMAGIFALSMGLAMLLFVALPNYATMLSGLVEIERPLAYNLVSGAARVCVIVAYIWLLSHLKDVRRLFQYHGAEHKVVMAYEKDIPLDIEHLRPVTTLHPRCGSTFIAVVLLVSILIFAVLAALIVPVYPGFNEWSVWARKPLIILLHILFMPLVGGIGYEITRRAGRRPDYSLYRLLLAPGLAFQRLTTKQPDDSMIEVALVSFHEALEPRKTPSSP